MKYLLLICSALLYLTSMAQPGISIEEVNQSFLGGEARPVYKLLIRQAKKKDVIKALEKRLERGTRQEANVNDNAMRIEKVFYKDYWTDSLTIHAEVVEVALGTMCYFAIDKDTEMVSSPTHRELDLMVRRYMKSFGLDMYEEALEDEMKSEEKHLKSIEKELHSAQSESDKYREKIEDLKLEIINKKEELSMNEADRQVKMQEISAQKLRISELDPAADSELKDAEKDKLSTLKKELKKNKQNDKKIRKEIFKMENDIRDLELEKEKADAHIKSVQGRVADQTAVIEEVRKKQYAVQDARKSMD